MDIAEWPCQIGRIPQYCSEKFNRTDKLLNSQYTIDVQNEVLYQLHVPTTAT